MSMGIDSMFCKFCTGRIICEFFAEISDVFLDSEYFIFLLLFYPVRTRQKISAYQKCNSLWKSVSICSCIFSSNTKYFSSIIFSTMTDNTMNMVDYDIGK